MKKQISYYRIIVNILRFILFVLLVSILFSFIFPLIQMIIWKSLLDPKDPIFSKIQIVIIILVFVFSTAYRKFCYLPIYKEVDEKENKVEEKKQDNVSNVDMEEKKMDSNSSNQDFVINLEKKTNLDVSLKDSHWENELPDLDIKIWRVIR